MVKLRGTRDLTGMLGNLLLFGGGGKEAHLMVIGEVAKFMVLCSTYGAATITNDDFT